MSLLLPINSPAFPGRGSPAASERASVRFLEFFAANIRTPHPRRPYVGPSPVRIRTSLSCGRDRGATFAPMDIKAETKCSRASRHLLSDLTGRLLDIGLDELWCGYHSSISQNLNAPWLLA
jgi:hypothetical protein